MQPLGCDSAVACKGGRDMTLPVSSCNVPLRKAFIYINCVEQQEHLCMRELTVLPSVGSFPRDTHKIYFLAFAALELRSDKQDIFQTC